MTVKASIKTDKTGQWLVIHDGTIDDATVSGRWIKAKTAVEARR